MSSLYHPIDIYCERTSPELFAEPLNAISNVAFLIAAYFLSKALKHHNMTDDKPLVWLVVLIFLIGLGSLAFHAVGNRLTMLMDVIPITAFLLSYIFIFCRWVGEQSIWQSAAWLGGFLLLSYLAGIAPESMQFNGTISYGPAFIGLIVMTLLASLKGAKRAAQYLKIAVLLFAASMVMRSMDAWICEYIPIGSHFLWHILNGIVLYKVTGALIVARQQLRASADE